MFKKETLITSKEISKVTGTGKCLFTEINDKKS